MDISIGQPMSDIHTWIYTWIYPWISISTATLEISLSRVLDKILEESDLAFGDNQISFEHTVVFRISRRLLLCKNSPIHSFISIELNNL